MSPLSKLELTIELPRLKLLSGVIAFATAGEIGIDCLLLKKNLNAIMSDDLDSFIMRFLLFLIFSS